MSSKTIALNTNDIKIINLLRHDDCVSGEFIAKKLGLSRTSVWKTVKKISALGLITKGTSGKGYTLAKDIKLLSKAEVDRYLSVKAKNLFKVHVAGLCGSTNDVLFNAAKTSTFLGYNVLLAEQQSNGKGRLGRSWVTPFGHQLAMSCHFKLEITDISSLYGISIAVGVCIVDVLRKLGFDKVGLKWPNDLYNSETYEKLGGILVEMQQEAEGPIHLVVGIGINCLYSDSLRDIPGVEASALDKLGKYANRSELCGNILNSLVGVYEDAIKGNNFESYLSRWSLSDIFHNKQVVAHMHDGTKIAGVNIGIDKTGMLLIKDTRKTHKICGSLCSIRLATHNN